MDFSHPWVAHGNDAKNATIDMKSPAKWSYFGFAKAGIDGTLRSPYTNFETQFEAPLGARDVAHHWTGFVSASAASLRHGKLTVQLEPERLIRGLATCDVVTEGNKTTTFPPTVSLYWHDNEVAGGSADGGEFQFPVPSGTYRLRAQSSISYVHYQFVILPAGSGDFILPPISLDTSEGLALIGKPAPALDGVVAWKNGSVDLNSLKGKVVLLNFWGYPTTVVISRDGKVLGETGKQVSLNLTADEKIVDAAVEKLLAAK
jgi:hypothetical protein